MLTTTHSVAGKTVSLTGKLIDCLLTVPSSPVHALTPGQLVSDYSGNGMVGFFIRQICPADLEAFKGLIEEMPMPASMHQEMSAEAWADSKKRVLKQLNPRHQ